MILIEDSDSYKGKTAGPRIRTLVQDPSALPASITLIGTDGATKQKIKVQYSGLHNQCNRCRGFRHYVKDCKQQKYSDNRRHQSNNQDQPESNADDQWKVQQRYTKRSDKENRSRKEGNYQWKGREGQVTQTNQEKRQDAEHLQEKQGQNQQEEHHYGKQKGSEKPNLQIWRKRTPKEPDLSSQLEIDKATRESETPQNPRQNNNMEEARRKGKTADTQALDHRDVADSELPGSSHSCSPKSNFGEVGEEGEKAKEEGSARPMTESVDNPNQQTSKEQEPIIEEKSDNSEGDHTLSLEKLTSKTQSNEESQDKKLKDISSPFQFGVGLTENQNKRGYRTTDLSTNFWKVLGIIPPKNAGAKRSVIIPMPIKKSWTTKEEEKHKFLAFKAGSLNNTVLRIQVSAHNSGTWSTDKAKGILTNEAAQVLNKVLKFGKGNYPPFTKWEDASWHFRWTTYKQSDSACCTWLSMIVLEANSEVSLHKPGKQRWINLPEEMEGLIKNRGQGVIEQLTEEFCAQLMDPLPGMQEPSPPKPATKKNKQEESKEWIESTTEDSEKEKGKASTAGNRAGQEDQTREEESTSQTAPETLHEGD